MNEWGMIVFMLCAGFAALYHIKMRRVS